MPKHVLITGYSKGGFGEALTLKCERKRIKVFAAVRDFTKVQHLREAMIEMLHFDMISRLYVLKAMAARQQEDSRSARFPYR
jgi:hypothetical protein